MLQMQSGQASVCLLSPSQDGRWQAGEMQGLHPRGCFPKPRRQAGAVFQVRKKAKSNPGAKGRGAHIPEASARAVSRKESSATDAWLSRAQGKYIQEAVRDLRQQRLTGASRGLFEALGRSLALLQVPSGGRAWSDRRFNIMSGAAVERDPQQRRARADYIHLRPPAPRCSQ